MAHVHVPHVYEQDDFCVKNADLLFLMFKLGLGLCLGLKFSRLRVEV